MSHAYVANCEDCGWLGSDNSKAEPAEREALEHESRPEREPIIPSSPPKENGASR